MPVWRLNRLPTRIHRRGRRVDPHMALMLKLQQAVNYHYVTASWEKQVACMHLSLCLH